MAKYFQTSDSILAATIIAGCGMQPIRVHDHSGHIEYEFEDDESVRPIRRAYEMGTMRVDPTYFIAAQQYLQTRINDSRKPGAGRDPSNA